MEGELSGMALLPSSVSLLEALPSQGRQGWGGAASGWWRRQRGMREEGSWISQAR